MPGKYTLKSLGRYFRVQNEKGEELVDDAGQPVELEAPAADTPKGGDGGDAAEDDDDAEAATPPAGDQPASPPTNPGGGQQASARSVALSAEQAELARLRAQQAAFEEWKTREQERLAAERGENARVKAEQRLAELDKAGKVGGKVHRDAMLALLTAQSRAAAGLVHDDLSTLMAAELEARPSASFGAMAADRPLPAGWHALPNDRAAEPTDLDAEADRILAECGLGHVAAQHKAAVADGRLAGGSPWGFDRHRAG